MRKRWVNLCLECEIEDERRSPEADRVFVKIPVYRIYEVPKKDVLWKQTDEEYEE